MHAIHPSRASAWLAPLALAACLAAAPAHAESSNTLRFFAVGGTLASWAYAAWEGAPLTDCAGAHWQLRGQVARDSELKLLSAGAAYGDCPMLSAGGWTLSHQTNFSVGRWNASGTVNGATRGADGAWDAAVVPLLHWQHYAFGPHRVELEFGVGPAWLSEPHVGDRFKSTQFQFSDHLGLNLIGGGDRWRAGIHWRHISNLDIRTPNNGVDFLGLAVGWSL